VHSSKTTVIFMLVNNNVIDKIGNWSAKINIRHTVKQAAMIKGAIVIVLKLE
jgi:hypothetical protein